jgi:hypothetical protein
MSKQTFWYVVTAGGPVLGVFGSALLTMAQECAARVERDTGMKARIAEHKGSRPSVGMWL